MKTEKFSENRGRPKIIQDESLNREFALLWGTKTRRTFLNRFYMQKAFGVLTDDKSVLPGFEYLFGGISDLNTANMKMTIISELGRLNDPGLIRHFATEICESKTPTKKAVQKIRNFRLKRGNVAGDDDKLIDAIIKTINDFIEQYPGTSIEQLKKAMETVQLCFMAMDE
jgi:hypothetical protein